MKIHKDLLTHDGKSITQNATGSSLVGKLLDLGFNGDFDHKKSDWNMLFIHSDGGSGNPHASLEVTVNVYSREDSSTSPIDQDDASDLVNSAYLIASVKVPADIIKNGGVVGLPMPRGLKRYFTTAITTNNNTVGTTAAKLTIGITDEVDTDTRLDWTNYKAKTGTSKVTPRSKNVGDVIAGNFTRP